MKFYSKFRSFLHSRKSTSKCHLSKRLPSCPGLNVLKQKQHETSRLLHTWDLSPLHHGAIEISCVAAVSAVLGFLEARHTGVGATVGTQGWGGVCGGLTMRCYTTAVLSVIEKESVNSSPPSAACMRRSTGSALFQIMAYRLDGAKPLYEPMLTYCQLEPKEHISMKFCLKCKHFHSRKCVWICHLRNGSHLVQKEMS